MEIERIQRTVQQAWSRQHWDDWRATCDDSYQFRLTSTMHLDLGQTLEWSRAWFAAFPDYTEEVRGVYVSAGSVAYEVTGRGTSSADLTFSGRTLIPLARGRTFTVDYAKVLVANAAGKVTHDRQYFDADALRRQLLS
ncbi:ester cyclase [Microbacterium sp. NPDC089698]|uniref:ester cyclase n=1 Tax=Microbacterium sp. NPDC089698 TaxID=3364200 RepID=UPI003806B966